MFSCVTAAPAAAFTPGTEPSPHSRHHRLKYSESAARRGDTRGDNSGDGLPRRGGRCDGDGVHRRAHRSRGCARHARRSSPRGQWSLARRLSLRAAPPGVAVLRRRVDGARNRLGAAAGSGSRAPRTGTPVGDPGVLRRRPAPAVPRVGPRHLPRGQRVPLRRLRARRDVAGVRRDGTDRRAPARGRRHLPLADDSRDDAAPVRRCHAGCSSVSASHTDFGNGFGTPSRPCPGEHP